MVQRLPSALQNTVFAGRFRPRRAPAACDGPPARALGTIAAAPQRPRRRRSALSSADPNYDAATDTYRQIYHGHDNASAVTNSEGLTVYFDPDTNDVLGFSIVSLRRVLQDPHHRRTASSR